MTCVFCSEPILESDSKFMLAIEKPYMNLYVHLICWNSNKNNLVEFLSAHLEEYLKISNNKKK